jgi:hypothetical protein
MYLPDKGIQREYSKDPYQASILLIYTICNYRHITYDKSGHVTPTLEVLAQLRTC